MGKIAIITLDRAGEHVLNKILNNMEVGKVQFVDIPPAPVLSLSNLSLYPHECKAEVNDQELTLRPRQFTLLYLPARNVGCIFTRGQIYYQVWNESTTINMDETVRYHVNEAREKLEQVYGCSYIETVRGTGYRFRYDKQYTIRIKFLWLVEKDVIETQKISIRTRKEMHSMLLAIDHGNKQIKMIYCPSFMSGLQQSIEKPFRKNITQCNGTCYTLSSQRIPYQKDKMEDDRLLCLTLFGATNEVGAMKRCSGDVIHIQLVAELLPAHFDAQNKSFTGYFMNQDVIRFHYYGKSYSIYIEDVVCFPQAYAATAIMMESLIGGPKALVLDIGGFTADYLLAKYGQVDLSACDSLESDVILLYSKTRSEVNAELDLLPGESNIDVILKERTSGYTEQVVQLVEYRTQGSTNDLFNTLQERMIDSRSGNVVLAGGGAILLRRQIEASGRIDRPLFVDEINANAKGYEFLYQLEMADR